MTTLTRGRNGAKIFRLMHTMVRVSDLERSIMFYTQLLGMTLFRREDYPSGRFTLAFVGYGNEQSQAAIELTYNWDPKPYDHGTRYGHIALEVADVQAVCAMLETAGVKVLRAAGIMAHESPQRSTAELIAFIEDPDGYRIELIETLRQGKAASATSR